MLEEKLGYKAFIENGKLIEYIEFKTTFTPIIQKNSITKNLWYKVYQRNNHYVFELCPNQKCQ